jgi:hypothetical protein
MMSEEVSQDSVPEMQIKPLPAKRLIISIIGMTPWLGRAGTAWLGTAGGARPGMAWQGWAGRGWAGEVGPVLFEGTGPTLLA